MRIEFKDLLKEAETKWREAPLHGGNVFIGMENAAQEVFATLPDGVLLAALCDLPQTLQNKLDLANNIGNTPPATLGDAIRQVLVRHTVCCFDFSFLPTEAYLTPNDRPPHWLAAKLGRYLSGPTVTFVSRVGNEGEVALAIDMGLQASQLRSQL